MQQHQAVEIVNCQIKGHLCRFLRSKSSAGLAAKSYQDK